MSSLSWRSACWFGNQLYEQGHHEKSLAAFRRAMEHNPDSVRAFFKAGAVLIVMGRLGEAEEYLLRALEIDPNYADVRNNWTELRKRQERQ